MEFYQRKKGQIIIGVPSKGRLKEHVTNFLNEKGYKLPDDLGRVLQTILNDDEQFKVVFAHPKDIPVLVDKGSIDIGFTGLDLIYETRVNVRPLIRLGLGKVKMALAVPVKKDITHPFHLMHKTVGTSFPNITKEYFDSLKVDVNIEPIRGASEGMPYLGVVDAIVDVVETGKSLVANQLEIIDDEIFDSECVLIVSKPEFQMNHELVHNFVRDLY